jgi:hypothetical protein
MRVRFARTRTPTHYIHSCGRRLVDNTPLVISGGFSYLCTFQHAIKRTMSEATVKYTTVKNTHRPVQQSSSPWVGERNGSNQPSKISQAHMASVHTRSFSTCYQLGTSCVLAAPTAIQRTPLLFELWSRIRPARPMYQRKIVLREPRYHRPGSFRILCAES